MAKKIIQVDYSAKEFSFLINCPLDLEVPIPDHIATWLPEQAWQSIQSLIALPGFETLSNQIEKEATKRYEEWYNELAPEDEKLSGEFKRLEQEPF